MGKIIVDVIQKTGGVEFTLPTTDGEPNQFMISDGSGNLGFSSFKVPDADGTAGQMLTTDGLGSLEFVDIPEPVIPPSIDYTNIGANNYNTAQYGTYLSMNLPQATDMMQNVVGSVLVGECTYHCANGSSGVSCTWTVPAGVTEAQFQIWGAGGNGDGGRNACCNVGYMGANGEYSYVWQNVTAGDTFTLCAGGSCACGSCSGGYAYNGCNSFACGTGSTCIMACGGHSGLGVITSGCYPKANPYGMHCCNYPNTGSMYTTSIMWCGNLYNDEAYRADGVCLYGLATTTYDVISCAKIPSAVGTMRACGGFGCSVRQIQAPVVREDHKIVRCATDYCTYGAGCCHNGCSGYLAGTGGFGAVNAVSCCTGYGERGKSGFVKVSYK